MPTSSNLPHRYISIHIVFFCILQICKGSVTDGLTDWQTLLKDASRIKNGTIDFEDQLFSFLYNNKRTCPLREHFFRWIRASIKETIEKFSRNWRKLFDNSIYRKGSGRQQETRVSVYGDYTVQKCKICMCTLLLTCF